MQILFDSHPKIKGCLNTMTPEQRRKIDFQTWEVNTDGYINCVDILIPDYEFEDKLLWADSGKNLSIDNSGMLPLSFQDWLDEHITGKWFYEVRKCTVKSDMFYRKMVFTFHFEKSSDAMFFKLTWE
jgi:hypothetical protein